MSKTSKYQPDRWHERLAYKRGEDNWKTEAAEELEQMADPEEVYEVVHEWEDGRYTLDERLGLHRTKAGAWLTLQTVAEGNSYYLNHDETSFSTVGNEWYIVPAVLED